MRVARRVILTNSPVLREGYASDGSRVSREVGDIRLLFQVPDFHNTTARHSGSCSTLHQVSYTIGIYTGACSALTCHPIRFQI